MTGGEQESCTPARPASDRNMPGAGRNRKLGGLSRRSRAVLLLAVTAGAAMFSLSRAWKETERREAYLPQLEGEAKRHPYDGRLQALLGGRLAEAKEYDHASDALMRAAANGESAPAVWLTWAACEAASGQRVQAGSVLRLGIRDPQIAPALQAALERCSVLPADVSASTLAESISPGGAGVLVDAYTQGSYLNGFFAGYARRHPYSSGCTTRQQWALQQHEDPTVQRLWAEALMENRRWPEALNTAQKAVGLAPSSPEAHLTVANIYARQGAQGRAGVEYMASLRLRKDWLPALAGLGHVAVEKRLIPIAVDVFERAVKQAPQSPDIWIGLGSAYYNQRLKLDKALEAFQMAARLAPHRTDFYADYSNALRNNYRDEQAEALLRRRLTAEPADARCHYLLALLLLDHKPTPERRQEAGGELETSLRLQPHVAAAETRLGRLRLQQGRPLDAIALLTGASEDDPYSALPLYSLARAYAQVGKHQESQHALAKAETVEKYSERVTFLEDRVQRQPENLDAHRELTTLFAQGGERDKAQREADMVHVLETHHPEAVKGLNDLNAATSVSPPARPQ